MCFAHVATVLLVFPGPRGVVAAFGLSPGLTVALGAWQPSRLVQTQAIALTLLPHRTQNQPFPLGLFSQGYMLAICVFSPRRNLESSFVTGVKKAPGSRGDAVGKGMPASERERPEDAAGSHVLLLRAPSQAQTELLGKHANYLQTRKCFHHVSVSKREREASL